MASENSIWEMAKEKLAENLPDFSKVSMDLWFGRMELKVLTEDTAYFQMRQRIQDLLAVLPEADAKLLTLRFSLEGGLPLSPEDTGRKLGLTPEEVVTKEAAALARLRNE